MLPFSIRNMLRGLLGHNLMLSLGLGIVLIMSLAAVCAPLLAPYPPTAQHLDHILEAPSSRFWLGTDRLGRDVFSRLLYGGRVSLWVGFVAVGISISIGTMLGLISGYFRRWVDEAIMRLVDIMLVIPTLPLTIVLTNLFGKSYFMIIFIFTLFGWTGLARVVRSQVLVLKNSNYVRAAELAGAGRWHIMFRHILPGVSHLLIMSTALTSAGIMVAEAGLSFLGLGDPTAISWGRMLADAQSGGALLFGHWWWIIAPGIGIFLSVFSFMRIGLAMEEIFNPRMKRSSGLYKLFRTLNNDYIQEVFDSMEEGGPGGPGKGGAYDG